MKIKLLFIAFPLMLPITAVQALQQDGRTGVGIILGQPTGLSIKRWLSDTRAVDGAAAWDLSGNDAFQLHADYLIHDLDLIPHQGLQGQLAFYYGIGGRMKLSTGNGGIGPHHNRDVLLGIRVPVGVDYLLPHTPIDIFGEIVPTLNVIPDTRFDVDAAVGARYYF